MAGSSREGPGIRGIVEPDQSQLQELPLDGLVHFLLAELVRYTNGVLDSVRIGASVADDANPFDTQ